MNRPSRLNRSPFALLSVAAVAILLVLVGCDKFTSSQMHIESNNGNDIAPKLEQAGPATFSNIYTSVLSSACIQCHVSGGSASTTPYSSNLDFSSQASAYATLMQNVSGSGSSGCEGSLTVAPGNPDASYLNAVLFSTYAGKWTACTPYANHLSDQNLAADEQSMIVSWIQAGAPNN